MATLCGLDWTIHVLWTNGDTSGPQGPSPLIQKPLLLFFFIGVIKFAKIRGVSSKLIGKLKWQLSNLKFEIVLKSSSRINLNFKFRH